MWQAGIALAVFLLLISGGVATNTHKSLGSLVGNGFFQLAVLELFLFSAGLAYYRYHVLQPGHIIIRLQPEQTKNYVRLGMKYQTPYSSSTDTVIAPTDLHNRYAGTYNFRILDKDLVSFKTEMILEPAETETLIVPVALDFKTITVQTNPEGSEIWIDDSLYSKTPDSVDVFGRDTIILCLKMNGYQTYTDTLALTDNINLGEIKMFKLFSLRVICGYEDIEYKIYNADNKVILKSIGSRSLRLPQGRYKIAYDVGEGQMTTERISLNYNYNLYIP